MKTKTIITTALLAFIFASIAFLIAKELRALAQATPAQTCPPAKTCPRAVINNEGASCEDANAVRPPTESPEKVVVYYFHNNFRCAKCQKFESYSEETLQTDFSDALNDGRIEWKVINIDKPVNKHFVGDYKLYTKSIIVAKHQDGRQTKWKNLEKIWDLVGDKTVFVKYIKDEVSAYLGAD
jgi:hypothetical protein